MNGTGADGFAQALDRRVTEGFNLVHGRLGEIQEDVRENRRDIKELRKELWGGLKDAAGDRAKLAGKSELAALRAEMHEGFARLEGSQRDLRAEMNERLATLEASQRVLIANVAIILERSAGVAWTRRQILVAVGGGIGLLVIGALLQPLLQRVVAALFGGG